MSKVAIQGNASGTGTFTIQSPATNTDRVLSLPDEAGTVLTSASSIPSSQITGSLGITEADLWRLTTTLTTNATLTNFEQPDAESPGTIGSSMSVSSGVFTFPSTGIWLIMVQAFIISDADAAAQCNLQVSTDGGSNFNTAAICDGGNSNASEKRATCFSQFILDVTSTSNIKVRLQGESLVGSEIIGDTNENLTSISFIRLGDT